jgi:hypothetical protein
MRKGVKKVAQKTFETIFSKRYLAPSFLNVASGFNLYLINQHLLCFVELFDE